MKMKDGVAEEQLSEIADIIMGQSPPSSTYNQEGKGLPFFQGKAEFGDIYPTVVKYCSKPARIAKPNDILMTVRAPVGPVNLSPSECCIGRGLAAIRGRQSKIDQMYLFYYLRSIESRLSKLGQGSTFTAIGRREIERIEVPHPVDLTVQRRIASTIQMAHVLTQKRERANQLTSKITQSIFLKMFGDPLTNPFRWDIHMLREVCNKITDGSHGSPPNSKEWSETGVPYITAKNVKPWGIDLTDLTYVKKEDHEAIFKRCNPEKYDVLYVKDGVKTGIAAVNLLDFEFTMLSSLALFKPNKSFLNPFFLEGVLNSSSMFSRNVSDMKGAAIRRLTLDQLSGIEIPVPPLNRQNQFGDFVHRFTALRQKQNKSTEQIGKLFRSLMHKAFRGELVA